MMAVSAPRGNLVSFWDGRDRRYPTSITLSDGCGVAPTDQAGAFMLTEGEGDVRLARPLVDDVRPIDMEGLVSARRDNHLRLVPQCQELS